MKDNELIAPSEVKIVLNLQQEESSMEAFPEKTLSLSHDRMSPALCHGRKVIGSVTPLIMRNEEKITLNVSVAMPPLPESDDSIQYEILDVTDKLLENETPAMLAYDEDYERDKWVSQNGESMDLNSLCMDITEDKVNSGTADASEAGKLRSGKPFCCDMYQVQLCDFVKYGFLCYMTWGPCKASPQPVRKASPEAACQLPARPARLKALRHLPPGTARKDNPEAPFQLARPACKASCEASCHLPVRLRQGPPLCQAGPWAALQVVAQAQCQSAPEGAPEAAPKVVLEACPEGRHEPPACRAKRPHLGQKLKYVVGGEVSRATGQLRTAKQRRERDRSTAYNHGPRKKRKLTAEQLERKRLSAKLSARRRVPRVGKQNRNYVGKVLLSEED